MSCLNSSVLPLYDHSWHSLQAVLFCQKKRWRVTPDNHKLTRNRILIWVFLHFLEPICSNMAILWCKRVQSFCIWQVKVIKHRSPQRIHIPYFCEEQRKQNDTQLFTADTCKESSTSLFVPASLSRETRLQMHLQGNVPEEAGSDAGEAEYSLS